MKKFKAEMLDLDLELTLLNGTTEELKPKIPLNANGVEMLLTNWKALENKYFDEAAQAKNAERKRQEKLRAIEEGENVGGQDERDESASLLPFKLAASRLAFLYNKSTEWFLENFFSDALTEITTYIIETITGAKKKSANSNPLPSSEDSESE